MPNPRDPDAPEEPILPGDTAPQEPDRRDVQRDTEDEPDRRSGAPSRHDIEREVPGTEEEDDDAQQQRRDMDERRPHREP